MLMLTTKQRAADSPGAVSFQAHRLPKDMVLADVFRIDVKTGRYLLGDQITIGTLGVDPILLSVQSDLKR